MMYPWQCNTTTYSLERAETGLNRIIIPRGLSLPTFDEKIIDLATLEEMLNPLEGDLLSEMVNDKEITIKFKLDKGRTLLEFAIPENEEQKKELTVLVIEPTKTKEKGT